MNINSALLQLRWLLVMFTLATAGTQAGQLDIIGPSGSENFGGSVIVLPNSNFVVRDTSYSIPSGPANVGAVYLYSSTGTLISMLTGSTANDQVGSSGVFVLSNGNYIVVSPNWNNGAATQAGAVTWCNANSGVTGIVSSSNSLVGSNVNDGIASNDVTTLSNGNYLVYSPNWTNGGIANAGAVTWGSGATGIAGAVSTSNSLVGSSTNDKVGSGSVTQLTNGNYVVRSLKWTTNAGAVTWGNGATGVAGVVSAANSLIGSTANDNVGQGLTALSNGNYVVTSPAWHNGAIAGAGAVTWGNGATGVAGAVSATNSLVGSTTNDQIGQGGVTALSNGNYVVSSSSWNGAMGASTWGNGATGIAGAVSASNSLVGSNANDNVGSGVVLLKNGNYVVGSPNWANGGSTFAGAITWGNGASGISGAVSAANSLVGSNPNDSIGSQGVTALSNGNYVVRSRNWANGGFTTAGAVTWGNGATGIVGAVSAANSLVGSSNGDLVGSQGVLGLSNGNYVVSSRNWANGGFTTAGAVTWGNGATGIVGAVSAANSLVGSSTNDIVGSSGATELSNGNYVVNSFNWNGAMGAVTWGNGTTGITGAVSAVNSLIGSSANDQVGSDGVITLNNGNYVVLSTNWNNGAATQAGAATWGNGTAGIAGPVTSVNSLVGSNNFDSVGASVTALSNGNYVVLSPSWANGAASGAGAATWGNGTTGIAGSVSALNSLVGSSTNDNVGGNATALSNGNYVVRSSIWNNGAASKAGAVTWGNGMAGIKGAVSAANSLIGSSANDSVGNSGLTGQTDSNYVVRSPNFANGALANAGAVTLGPGSSGIVGALADSNSVLGTAAGGGGVLVFGYDTLHAHIVVGRPSSNIVTIFGSDILPDLTVAMAHAGNFTQGDASKMYIITITNAGVIPTTGTITATLTTLPAGLTATAFTGTGWTQTSLAPPTATFSGVLATGAINNALALTVNVAGNASSPLTPVVTVSGGGETNSANDTASDSTTIASSTKGLKIDSGPTALPLTAGVGQAVAFAASASGGTGTLTYTWKFGDGTPVATGSNVTHAYAGAGSYSATLTVTDAASGTVSAQVTVTVNAPLVGTGNDMDGDGFSDAFETGVGSDPASATSTPTGQPATTGSIKTLSISKPSIKLNFTKSNADAIAFSGTLDVPAGFNPKTGAVSIDVGGVAKSLTLLSKGNNAIKLTIKAKKGVVAAQSSKYSVSFKNGNFATALANFGLAKTGPAKPVSVPFTLVFNNTIYQATPPLQYTVLAKGKSGAAK